MHPMHVYGDELNLGKHVTAIFSQCYFWDGVVQVYLEGGLVGEFDGY